MRGIKFRAWDKKEKKIIVRGLLLTLEQGLRTFDFPDFHVGFVDDDRYILMQYTGLKDKNGKEIYEGDIIEIDDDWKGGEGERGEVRWDGKNATFRLFCYTKYGGEGWFMPENKTWIKLKIIGNIYENPKLLSGVIVRR